MPRRPWQIVHVILAPRSLAVPESMRRRERRFAETFVSVIALRGFANSPADTITSTAWASRDGLRANGGTITTGYTSIGAGHRGFPPEAAPDFHGPVIQCR